MKKQIVKEVVLETVEDPAVKYFGRPETPEVPAGWTVEAMLRVGAQDVMIIIAVR